MTFALKKLVIGSVFDDAPIIHDIDHISFLDGTETVTDGDNRLILFSEEMVEYPRLSQRIYRARWLIENDIGSISIEIACQRKPLPLATR